MAFLECAILKIVDFCLAKLCGLVKCKMCHSLCFMISLMGHFQLGVAIKFPLFFLLFFLFVHNFPRARQNRLLNYLIKLI